MNVRVLLIGVCLFIWVGISNSACRKAPQGICSCEYITGETEEFDYSLFSTDEANAKCDSTSEEALSLGGECQLR